MADNSVLDAFYSLGKKINKAIGNEVTPEIEEGIVSEKLPELTLDMSDEELLQLTEKWEKDWTSSEVYQEWLKQSTENENYWMGKQFNTPKVDKTRPLVDNVIFESLETYLPQVTQHNPEAVVVLSAGVEQTPENLAYATDLKTKLGELADEIKLRLKLKKGARHWAIYLAGAAKLGWDMDKDIPAVKIVRMNKLILDPAACTDEDGYSGDRIGEHRKMEASKMLILLEQIGGNEGFKKAIEDLVGADTGTEIGFIEWWTDTYMCWTMKNHVLLKKKNPHWNYDQESEIPPQEAPQMAQAPVMPEQMPTEGYSDATDTLEPQDGMPQMAPEAPIPQQEPEMQTTPGFNHLTRPMKPYILLSVFNLGNQPIDNTSLIGQNLASQDLINKRIRQIDKNADSMNGGMVVSGERSGLSQQQSKGVTDALRKGGTIYIPAGAVNEAIARMSAPGLPNDVYVQLQDTRARAAAVFGVKGFQPIPGGSQVAVRNQLLNKTADEGRISGGFSEYLEQFADDIYNWVVQLLYVYDDRYAGQEHPKVNISIKEGSLLPKDSAAIAAQAIQLSSAGKMATVDLYKKLEYPNPEEMAVNAWLEINAPQLLYADDPRVKQALQMAAESQQGAEKKEPSQSINFKDLPPGGQAQMAAKVGIELHPEGIAAHEEFLHERDRSIPEPQTQLNQGYVQPQ